MKKQEDATYPIGGALEGGHAQPCTRGAQGAILGLHAKRWPGAEMSQNK